MRTRQYFEYEHEGKTRQYLLMPDEGAALAQLINEGTLTVKQAFERIAGHRDGVSNVTLVVSNVHSDAFKREAGI